MHKIDAASREASYDPELRLDRFVVAEGVDMWIGYGRGEGHRLGISSDRLEIATQLAGEMMYGGPFSRGLRIQAGMLHHLNAVEPHSIAYRADGPFIAMGITIDPALICPDEVGRDLRVPEGVDCDRELLDLFEEAYRLRALGEALPLAAIEQTVRRHLERVIDLTPSNPVARARQLVEQYFDSELYLPQVADEAGLSKVQLLRQFGRRYGTTPVHYRTQVRLARAGRLAWSSPELTTSALSERTGFRHLGYFHRSYRAYFGATPAVHRRSYPVSSSLRGQGLDRHYWF